MDREAPSVQDLEHHALRNALYHTARRQRLETWDRVLTFFVIVGGAATVIQVLDGVPWLKVALGIAITAIGALKLVLNFGSRARDHQILQRRYYEILGDIKEGGNLSEKQRYKIMGDLARIAGDEPPTLRALDAVAYNEATDSLYGETASASRIPITKWQDFTKHFLTHNGAPFDREIQPPPTEESRSTQ